MSFLDELNEISKTPEEAAAEKYQDDYQYGMKFAEYDFMEVKSDIKEKAKEGKYITEDGKRTISFYEECYLNKFSRPIVEDLSFSENRMIETKVQFKFEGIGYYDGYVHHINKLAEENGMSMKVVGTVLRETDLGVDQEFDLPDPQIFHSKMYKPLKIMLHCRIEF